MAVNVEQAADWNGDSGREFVEQRERLARITAVVRDRLAPYASPDGVIMPGAAWLVTGRAV